MSGRGPVTLHGAQVTLAPLAAGHAAGLFAAGSDPAVWQYLPHAPFHQHEDARAFIAGQLRSAQGGASLPFAVLARGTGEVLGMARFSEIQPGHRSLEIGMWLAPQHQRTGVHTECEYLLLHHAFEQWGARRVQWKTDARHERGRRALARLGCREEAVLRKYRLDRDGRPCDLVVYSVLAEEWPEMRRRLELELRPTA